MRVIGHYFRRSKHVKATSLDEIRIYEDRGYKQGHHSIDGGVHMVKPCEAWICFETDSGNEGKQDMRDEILKFYDKKALRLEKFDAFIIDILTKKVILYFDQEGMVRIKKP